MFDENKIILVKGKNGKWSFPKGKFEKSKDLNGYECARREFLEETGLVGFEYVYNSSPEIEFTEKNTISCKYYRCKITSKNSDFTTIERDNNDEIVETKWMTLYEILQLDDSMFYERRKKIAVDFLNSIQYGGFDMMDKFMIPWKFTKISKSISYWLRHHLNEFISVTSDAYVDIDELLNKINSDPRSEFNVTEDDIRHINFHCFKQRTQIKDNRIRCVQGHSSGDINDEKLLELLEEPITNCYHATNSKSIKSIMKKGLNKMTRKHIHFATDTNLLRKNTDILIEIKMKEAMDNGIKFYRAKNNVILSPGIDGVIPPEYLIIHKN